MRLLVCVFFAVFSLVSYARVPDTKQTPTAVQDKKVKPAIKTPPIAKVFRSNPLRLSLRLYNHDIDDLDIDDTAAIIDRKQATQKRNKVYNDDRDVSDYVKARLMIARYLAIKKYQRLHQQT